LIGLKWYLVKNSSKFLFHRHIFFKPPFSSNRTILFTDILELNFIIFQKFTGVTPFDIAAPHSSKLKISENDIPKSKMKSV